MNEEYQRWATQFQITGPISEAIIGATKPEYVEIMRTTLEKHGCTYETLPDKLVRVTFPQGSTRTELWSSVHTTRYRIDLPDKYEMQIDHLPNGVNILGFPENLIAIADAEREKQL